ncbi:MAG: ATP-binding protein, partial [Acidimicrobiia bacterium]
DDNSEPLRDEILGFTAGLLGMVGIDSDPISSRETILITNLIEHAWRNGQSLDIASLLTWIQQPPIRKLGVFEVDTFFPPKERLDLAMKINGLLASPGFATWMDGPPLDIESLLWSDDGTPQAAIVYLAHLSDDERQFVVTLILSKLITWMRRQPGSGELRALVYMDEVYGFAPPTAQPPSKKPILTLLKQARAFGVGLLLATQNPVDLDYKAMSNAGTWCIGRLQTERDKKRILEALSSAGGETDVHELDRQISGLGKRVFLLHTTRDEPTLFTTRWAMSYLRGPLTPAQITRLTPQRPERLRERGPVTDSVPMGTGPESIMPAVADGIPVWYLDPAATWSSDVGADPTSKTHEAGVAVRLTARYDERRAGIDHTVEWETILFPLSGDIGEAIEVDYDERDFRSQADPATTYCSPLEPIGNASFWTALGRGLKERLHREGEITVFKNGPLKMYSRVDEPEDDFAERCRSAAEDASDVAASKLRDKYEKRLRQLQRDIDKYAAQAESAAADASAGDFDMMAGAVFDMLSGRKRSRSVSSSIKTRRAAERRVETAQGRVDDRLAEYEGLQRDFEDEVSEIVELWDGRSEDIEPITVRLEKNDITVSETALVWIPRP